MTKRVQKKRWNHAAKITHPYLAEVDEIPEGYETSYPWKAGDTVLILGEIEQMPGHCVVVTRDGRTHFGYHTDNFRKLSKEEA